MSLKVGDKVVCEKFYFAMNSKGVAYYNKSNLYEITFVNHLGVNIKDDKGLELWFGFSGHCAFYEYFITLAEYREKRIDEILE
jgi:hypothetical protein